MAGGSLGTKRITEAIGRNDTSFDTRIADVTTNRLDLPATYPPNTERHKLVVNGSEVRDFAGSAKFTDQPGKWQLTVSAGDTVEFASRERFRYVPNYELLFGAVAWYDSTPASDQHLFVEASDDARDNVYRYELTPSASEAAIVSGGSAVDTLAESEWGDFATDTAFDHNPFTQEGINRTTPLNPRGFLNWYGAGNFRPTISYTRPDGSQSNPQLGTLANQDDVATEEINLRVRVVADADAGAGDFTVNIGSLGALVRGNANQVDRPKPFTVPDISGSFGGDYADNEPILAIRSDPDLPQVVSEILAFKFDPGGDDVVEVSAVVVDAADTDASNWQYPNIQAGGDATDSQNTAIQATTNVSTFPTTTKTTVSGTSQTAPDPDRLLTTTVSSGSKKGGGVSTSDLAAEEKRVFDDDEVVLFLPRRFSGTSGGINWITIPTRQDW